MASARRSLSTTRSEDTPKPRVGRTTASSDFTLRVSCTSSPTGCCRKCNRRSFCSGVGRWWLSQVSQGGKTEGWSRSRPLAPAHHPPVRLGGHGPAAARAVRPPPTLPGRQRRAPGGLLGSAPPRLSGLSSGLELVPRLASVFLSGFSPRCQHSGIHNATMKSHSWSWFWLATKADSMRDFSRQNMEESSPLPASA